MFRCRIIDLIGVCRELSKIIDYKGDIRLSLTYGVHSKSDSRLIPEAKVVIFLLAFSGMIVGCSWLH